MYGLAEGLASYGFQVKIAAPINIRKIDIAIGLGTYTSSAFQVDFIDMRDLGQYIFSREPDICIFTNFTQHFNLDDSFEAKYTKLTGKPIFFVYDLFAPKVLEAHRVFIEIE